MFVETRCPNCGKKYSIVQCVIWKAHFDGDCGDEVQSWDQKLAPVPEIIDMSRIFRTDDQPFCVSLGD
jgi:hypothetical protein